MTPTEPQKPAESLALITTIGERCRMCYTCVRDCPAKAIRIQQGQAQVIPERCIGCGCCVRVCSQNAKKIYDSLPEVKALLAGQAPVAAILAPSFAADFADLPAPRLVGALRQLGFARVAEVAFGADLVAAAYHRLLATVDDRRYVATTCPAVVGYIQKYHPNLIPLLAPIVSPMIAEARALKRLHGAELRVVFIGPCLAKKLEARTRPGDPPPDVDAVLTFKELRAWMDQAGLQPAAAAESKFDPPRPGLGALFPVSRGLLQAANLQEDLVDNNIVVAGGPSNFAAAIKEFEEGSLDSRLLEVLCCDGCIMGAGATNTAPHFSRQAAVSRYVRERMKILDPAAHARDLAAMADLDLRPGFHNDDRRFPYPAPEELDRIMVQLGKLKPEDELNCGACGYSSCRDHAQAIYWGLAESAMCLPYVIDRLRQSLGDLEQSNEQLARAREALSNAEKLASMGQLAAGIAHEVNNPLGVILLFAKSLLEECPPDAPNYEDLKMISEQAERCKKIVGDLLNFARKNEVHRRPTNLRDLIDRCLTLIAVPENVRVTTRHNMTHPEVAIDSDQIVQVLINLVENAIEAMPTGGELTLSTSDDEHQVRFSVADTGTGIAPEHRAKIFEPLFTTKQIGKGTGLGLSVTFGIIKMHRGKIDFTSNADRAKGPTGTTFTVTLPRQEEE